MSDSNSYLEELDHHKPESFEEEIFEKAPFNFKPFVTVIVLSLLILGVFLLYRSANTVTVPDYSGWTLEEMQQWTEQHGLSPIYKSHYSMEIGQNALINVGLETGDKIGKKEAFTITYSAGPDPNEYIQLIDFKGLALSEVQDFITTHKATSISVKKEYSDVVAEGTVINYEFKDGSFDQYQRKNRMTVYVSQGSEKPDDTIKMPNFLGQSKAQVIDWMNTEKIHIDFDYVYNEHVAYDTAFEQSIKSDTKINRDQGLSVKISKGKAITVPDFQSMSRSQVQELASYYNIKVFFNYKVSSQEVDTVLSQDIPSSQIIDSQTLVTLTLAKESQSVEVPTYVGLTRNEVEQLSALNTIKVFIKEVDSTQPSGKIIHQSHKSGSWVKKDQIITLEVSNGLIEIPDFSNMSKDQVILAANRLKLNVEFREVSDTSVAVGTIINQTIKAGNIISSQETLVCDVASHLDLIIPDLTSKSRTEVELWAQTHDIKLNIVESYHNTYPSGKLYDQNIVNSWITSDDILTIYYSLGKVVVYDFIGKTKVDVVTWANEVNQKNGDIKLLYTLTTNTKESRGTVTDQSIISDYVKTGSTLVVTVSATSNGIVIPSLTNMSYSEFIKWAEKNEVPYIVSDIYSDEINIGKMFGQNYAGKSLPNGKVLEIKQSLGPIIVPDFTGQTKDSVEAWKSDVNTKGGSITVIYQSQIDVDVPKDLIISNTASESTININGHITVTISLGEEL